MFTDKKSSWFQSSSAWTLGGVAAVALTAITSRFRIARPNERLIRTGFLCKGTNIPLRCFHIPFLQTFSRLSLEPGTFKIPIEAMSKERISFHMPTVWTLGPKEDSASLSKYAERLISMDHKQLERFYSGIIEGEGRIIAGSMELDELQDFDTVGVKIINVNVAELADTVGQEYFAERRKRALSEAMNTARRAVAEATRDGDSGVAKATAETREQKANYDRQATLEENKQLAAIWTSRAQLAETQYKSELAIALAKAKKESESEQKSSEYRKLVEEAKEQETLARQRAHDLSVVKVIAETKVEEAKGQALAILELAEADAKVVEIKARAARAAEEHRAAGLSAVLTAEANGLQQLTSSAGSVKDLNNYLLVKQGSLDKVMAASVAAVKDMKPVISVSQWNRSSNGNDNANSSANDTTQNPVVDLMTLAPQVVKEMEKVTGLQLFPQLFKAQSVSPASATKDV